MKFCKEAMRYIEGMDPINYFRKSDLAFAYQAGRFAAIEECKERLLALAKASDTAGDSKVAQVFRVAAEDIKVIVGGGTQGE